MSIWYVFIFTNVCQKKTPQKTQKNQLVNVVKQYGGVDVQETIKQKLAGQFR